VHNTYSSTVQSTDLEVIKRGNYIMSITFSFSLFSYPSLLAERFKDYPKGKVKGDMLSCILDYWCSRLF